MIASADGVESNWDECTPSFDLMDLKEDLLRGAPQPLPLPVDLT